MIDKKIIWLFLMVMNFSSFLFSQSVRIKLSFIDAEGQTILFSDTAKIYVDKYLSEKKGGIYSVRIPSDLSSAMVNFYSAKWRILYPVDHNIYIPRDTNYVIPVILKEGKTRSEIEELAFQIYKLKEKLDTATSQKKELLQKIETLGKKGSSLDSLAFLEAYKKEARKNGYLRDISSTLLNYINEAKDFKDAFRFLSKAALTNQGILEEMHRHVRSYDSAYQALNNSKAGFASTIQAFWDEGLKTDYLALSDYLLDDIHHSKIYALNPLTERINNYHLDRSGVSSKKEEEEGLKKDIDKAVLDLEIVLPVAEKKTNIFIEKLTN